MILKEFLTKWGFVVDDAALIKVDKKFSEIRVKADATGRAAVGAFDKPRDAMGRFLQTKFPVNGAGPGGAIGGYQQSLDMITESASSARRAVLGLTAAFAVGGLGLGGLFKIMSDSEQTEVAFDVLIGDAEKAKATLADLRKFAMATPFNFSDVAQLSKKLLAYNFAADELIPTMKALGDIAAGVGKDKLPQLVLALGQVRSATKLRGSELRQFTEAGVPLISELAKTLNTSEAAIQGMVEAGKVGFKDVYKSLENLTGEGGRLNNLMARQAGTLGGLTSNIVDNMEELVVAMGKRGLLGRSKQFLQGVLNFLQTNREKILVAMQATIEQVIVAMENIIDIGRGAAHVFQGLAQSVGGTKRAFSLVIKSLMFITSAGMLFLLGKASIGVMGLARAFVGLGDAALVSQIKMFGWAIVIGAAIALVALAIEDVVAYFQGRDSITGLILKDIGGISAGIDQILNPIFEKIKTFGKGIGKSLIDGLAALTAADWAKIGDVMLAGLEVALNVASLPIRIGMAIASGILEGLQAGMREKFPKMAKFFDMVGNPEHPDLKNVPYVDASAPVNGFMAGLGGLMKGDLIGKGMTLKTLPPAPTAGTSIWPQGSPMNQPAINIGPPNISVVVPPGTPAENVGAVITDAFQNGMNNAIREALRANRGGVFY